MSIPDRARDAEPAEHAAPGREIERRFLVAVAPRPLGDYPAEVIEQGYLWAPTGGAEVRLRSRGAARLLTVKHGSGLVRLEEEFPIERARFERLWALTGDRRIRKTRHRIPAQGGLTIELDVYSGALAGLVVAEVEFGSSAAADAFEPPAWFGCELTGNRRYGNHALASDGLPGGAPRPLHLRSGEPSADGLRRVASGQLAEALTLLRSGNDFGAAVHGARKRFKRVRSYLRLAREAVQPDAREHDNDALRAAGQRLSGARDAKVVVETLDALVARHPQRLGSGQAAGLRAALVSDYELVDRRTRSDPAVVDGVIRQLEATYADIASWEPGPRPAEALAAGLARIHRRGRKAFALAEREPTTEHFHELRKRAKDLWYAAELLEAAAPRRLGELAERAHVLTEVIGDEHDLAVLAERVEARRADFAWATDAAAVEQTIDGDRARLQRRALKRAAALYAKPPREAVKRVAALDQKVV